MERLLGRRVAEEIARSGKLLSIGRNLCLVRESLLEILQKLSGRDVRHAGILIGELARGFKPELGLLHEFGNLVDARIRVSKRAEFRITYGRSVDEEDVISMENLRRNTIAVLENERGESLAFCYVRSLEPLGATIILDIGEHIRRQAIG